MIRMILIENVEEGVLAAMELMQELPIYGLVFQIFSTLHQFLWHQQLYFLQFRDLALF